MARDSRVSIVKRKDRGGLYYLRWTESGKLQWKSARTRRATRAAVLAEGLEAELVAAEQLGMTPRQLQQARQPLAEHVAEFVVHLTARGGKAKHVQQSRKRLERALTAMRATRPADLNRGAAEQFLVDLKAGRHGKPASPKTVDDHLAVLKQFGGWLADAEPPRLPSNPFRKLVRLVTRSTHAAHATFTHRALSMKELEAVVQAAHGAWQGYARKCPHARREVLEGFQRAGQDRALAYMFAAATAARHTALAALRWRDLDLASDKPAVLFQARYAKNERPVRVPLVPWLAAEMREWRRTRAVWFGKPVHGDDPVFGLPPVGNRSAKRKVVGWLTSHIERKLQQDAKAAGIVLHDRERITFHGLKHTAGHLCLEHGVHPEAMQQWLQHSTLEQTMVYAKRHGSEIRYSEASKLPVPSIAGTLATNVPIPRERPTGPRVSERVSKPATGPEPGRTEADDAGPEAAAL